MLRENPCDLPKLCAKCFPQISIGLKESLSTYTTVFPKICVFYTFIL